MDALRSFEAAVNSDDGYGTHPADFTLFVVGEFDELTGFISTGVIEPLENGINLVKSPTINDLREGLKINEDA
jgi:hypothetical protein